MERKQLVLRLVQLLLSFILTGLVGAAIENGLEMSPSASTTINFSMFVVVVSWIAAILGLVTGLVQRINLPVLVLLGVDALVTLFALIDGIVLAAKLGAVNCRAREDRGADWIGIGTIRQCQLIQASTAFMWFISATFAASLALSFLGFRRGGGSIRSSVPPMSELKV